MAKIVERFEWRIELISADDEGCRFYLDHYKPFRLVALKQDPDGRSANNPVYFAHICFWGRNIYCIDS